MKQQNGYKIEIQNPCQESWDAMKETEGGKFCFNCQKNVMDFTQLSDNDIIKIIESAEGKICGRLSKAQLDRVLISQDIHTTHSNFYKIAAGLLAFSLLPTVNFAQQIISDSSAVYKSDLMPLPAKTVSNDTAKNVVKGIIKSWDTDELLTGATIHLKNTTFGTVADVDGKFELIIPEELMSNSMTFYVSYTGFETSEVNITKEKLPMDAYVYLNESNILLGEMVIVGGLNIKSTKINRKKKRKH